MSPSTPACRARVPELPDVTVYVEALARRVGGARLERIRLASPFVLRSVDPPVSDVLGRTVTGVRRLGKRVVIVLENERFVVIHLMIAGRLHWKAAGARPPAKIGVVAFDFTTGTLLMTEAGTKKRAAVHVVRGEAALAEHDPGGVEPLAIDLTTFHAALTAERHTLKRTLTDPHVFAGIGNAYSDEILHRARMSPVRLTTQLSDDDVKRLYDATRTTLTEWTERLRRQAGDEFPEGVTAFRPEMAVHGKYGKPCPACGAPVQRIIFAENETNYCAKCQTEGRLLADRSLSRLMHADWPKTLEELEERKLGRVPTQIATGQKRRPKE